MPNQTTLEAQCRILSEILSTKLNTNCTFGLISNILPNLFDVKFSPEKNFSDLQTYTNLLNSNGINATAMDDIFSETDSTYIIIHRKLRIEQPFERIIEALRVWQPVHGNRAANSEVGISSSVISTPRMPTNFFSPQLASGPSAKDELPVKLKSYIKSLNEPFSDVFERLEIEVKSGYICPVSLTVPKIPVLLDGNLFDLDSLIKLSVKDGYRLNPLTKEKFTLNDVMPGRVIVNIFENLIEEANQKNTISNKH